MLQEESSSSRRATSHPFIIFTRCLSRPEWIQNTSFFGFQVRECCRPSMFFVTIWTFHHSWSKFFPHERREEKRYVGIWSERTPEPKDIDTPSLWCVKNRRTNFPCIFGKPRLFWHLKRRRKRVSLKTNKRISLSIWRLPFLETSLARWVIRQVDLAKATIVVISRRWMPG